jgi:thymidylate synthase (FAD)
MMSVQTKEYKLLDYGYLKYIESWGSDERIIEAARMSTNKGFLGWGGPCRCTDDQVPESIPPNPNCSECKGIGKTVGDEKLLAYLYKMKHSTPFEMAGMTLEIQAPIQVFREWHRHRTMSYSEMSARYTPLPDVNYIPTVERLMMNSKTNKQAGTIKGADELSEARAELFRQCLEKQYLEQEQLYQHALQHGVPKELARLHIGVGRYSRMRASANLRNWLAFLTLRMDQAAQWEIRQYANTVGELISQLYPRTWQLFIEGMKR